MTKQYTLGTAMIVKDEIRCVGRCLNTIIPWLDEIVIVDTGSTDGTLEYLRSVEQAYPDKVKVYEKKWTGHFAEMRNYAHRQTTTDFLFTIDADEWVPLPNRSPGNPWNLIYKALIEAGDQLDAAYIKVYNYLPEGQILEGDLHPALRLIHNGPKVRWEGTVHNQIITSIKNNPRNGKEPMVGSVDMVLEHDGYNLDNETKKRKFEVRIPGLIQEINLNTRLGKDNLVAYYRFQLGNGYYMVQDFANSVKAFKEVIWDDLIEANQFSALSVAITACILEKEKELAHELSIRMVKLRPKEPMSLLQKGLTFFSDEKWVDAYTFIITAIAFTVDPAVEKTHYLDVAYCNGLLAECLFQEEQYHEAMLAAMTCLQRYNEHPRSRKILQDSLAVIREGTTIDWELPNTPIDVEVKHEEKERFPNNSFRPGTEEV